MSHFIKKVFGNVSQVTSSALSQEEQGIARKNIGVTAETLFTSGDGSVRITENDDGKINLTTASLDLSSNGAIDIVPDTTAGTLSINHHTQDRTDAAAVKVGNDAFGHVVLGDAITPADIGASASTHTHGNMSNSGAIASSTAATISSGDHLVITDSSDSDKLTNSSIAFGSDTSKYLRMDGSWGVPSGTDGITLGAGTANGTVRLLRDGVADADVAVTGLGSLAYIDSPVPIANGGTNATTAKGALHNIWQGLEDWTTPYDGELLAASNSNFTNAGRYSFLETWNNYYKGKIESDLGLTASSYGGTASQANQLTLYSIASTVTSRYGFKICHSHNTSSSGYAQSQCFIQLESQANSRQISFFVSMAQRGNASTGNARILYSKNWNLGNVKLMWVKTADYEYDWYIMLANPSTWLKCTAVKLINPHSASFDYGIEEILTDTITGVTDDTTYNACYLVNVGWGETIGSSGIPTYVKSGELTACTPSDITAGTAYKLTNTETFYGTMFHTNSAGTIDDTGMLRIGYAKITDSYSTIMLAINHNFYEEQHYSTDIVTIYTHHKSGRNATAKVTWNNIGGLTRNTYYYCIDSDDYLWIAVKIPIIGNGYGFWGVTQLTTVYANNFTPSFAQNRPTTTFPNAATKLSSFFINNSSASINANSLIPNALSWSTCGSNGASTNYPENGTQGILSLGADTAAFRTQLSFGKYLWQRDSSANTSTWNAWHRIPNGTFYTDEDECGIYYSSGTGWGTYKSNVSANVKGSERLYVGLENGYTGEIALGRILTSGKIGNPAIIRPHCNYIYADKPDIFYLPKLTYAVSSGTTHRAATLATENYVNSQVLDVQELASDAYDHSQKFVYTYKPNVASSTATYTWSLTSVNLTFSITKSTTTISIKSAGTNTSNKNFYFFNNVSPPSGSIGHSRISISRHERIYGPDDSLTSDIHTCNETVELTTAAINTTKQIITFSTPLQGYGHEFNVNDYDLFFTPKANSTYLRNTNLYLRIRLWASGDGGTSTKVNEPYYHVVVEEYVPCGEDIQCLPT